MAGRQPKRTRTDTVVPFRKLPVCRRERREGDARWQTLLAAVADIHAIIIRGVLSGAFQKDEAGPTIAAGAALLAAYDDIDLLLQATLLTSTAAILTALPSGSAASRRASMRAPVRPSQSDGHCALCGALIPIGTADRLLQMSRDRIDSSNKAYDLDNVQITHLACNLAKSEATSQDWLEYLTVVRG